MDKVKFLKPVEADKLIINGIDIEKKLNAIEDIVNPVPKLSGKWKVFSYPIEMTDAHYKINFTSNGNSYTGMVDRSDGCVRYMNGDEVAADAYWGDWSDVNFSIIDFGTEPQIVTEEFYKWFTHDAYQIKFVGEWKFKDKLYFGHYDGIRHKVNFTSGGRSFTEMYADPGEAIFYDGEYVMSGGWGEYPQYQIVDFGTEEQELTEEFISWFTRVAAPYDGNEDPDNGNEDSDEPSTISGMYRFHDYIEQYDDLARTLYDTEYLVNFTSNGMQFYGMYIDSSSTLYYITSDGNHETVVQNGNFANDDYIGGTGYPEYQTIDFGPQENPIDENLYAWIKQNATQITLETRVATLEQTVAELKAYIDNIKLTISGT